METTPPLCECHGKPMYWHKKKDMRAGGLWRCLVRKREVDIAYRRTRKGTAATQRSRPRDAQQKRARYDADPVYRIGKNLHDGSRKRRQTIERKRQQEV